MPQMVAAVHARLLPTLVDIVKRQEDAALLGLVERSVELIKCIAEATPTGQPFPAGKRKLLHTGLTAGALFEGTDAVACAVPPSEPSPGPSELPSQDGTVLGLLCR